MVDYNVVKKCRLCSGRFVVNKVDKRKGFCDPCQKRMDKSKSEEEDNDDEDEE
jgi:hypothetical protein